MGEKDEAQSPVSETQTVVDFLYVDKERADSFISQIRSGTLRSVTKTKGVSEATSYDARAGAPGFFGGTYRHEQKDHENASEQYDPYHAQLLDLLHDLNIHEAEQISSDRTGQLILLKAPLSIRDTATMRALLGVAVKHKKLTPVSSDGEASDLLDMVNDILLQMPDSISVSVHFRGTVITGTLKESGLTIRQDDLMRTYGVHLPGEWYILGVIDAVCPQNDSAQEVNSIEDAMDLCSSLTSSLFHSSVYKIIPVLIFRPVSLST